MYEEESSSVLQYVSGEFWRHLWKKLLKTSFFHFETNKCYNSSNFSNNQNLFAKTNILEKKNSIQNKKPSHKFTFFHWE